MLLTYVTISYVTFLLREYINLDSLVFNILSSHVNTKLFTTRSLHAQFLISFDNFYMVYHTHNYIY